MHPARNDPCGNPRPPTASLYRRKEEIPANDEALHITEYARPGPSDRNSAQTGKRLLVNVLVLRTVDVDADQLVSAHLLCWGDGWTRLIPSESHLHTAADCHALLL